MIPYELFDKANPNPQLLPINKESSVTFKNLQMTDKMILNMTIRPYVFQNLSTVTTPRTLTEKTKIDGMILRHCHAT
jgi:hypothetical protein